MISVNSFQGGVTPSTTKTSLSATEGFSSVMMSQEDASSSGSKRNGIGMKVGLDYMFSKLEEHGFITPEDREYLQSTVTDRNQMDKAVLKLKGPGLAANAAYKMQEGVLLPNGILTLTDQPKQVEQLSHLTKWEVNAIEAATGCDMSIGQVGILGQTVSHCKDQGIITGEMGLKDFTMLRSCFKENGKPGSREYLESQKMLDRLYEILSQKDSGRSPEISQ